MPNFSVILGNLGQTCDRFLPSGYKEQPPKAEQFRQAGAIKGVTGIELISGWDLTAANVREVKSMMADNGLKLASIIPDHFGTKQWGKGSFTSRDPAIRAAAVRESTAMMDLAVELGGDLINLWPGQDGFDYPFQADHDDAWNWMVEGVRTAAKHRADVRLSLEYKIKEPRTHCLLSRAAETLLIAEETGCANVGVTIDTGHSFMAYENLSEAAALLMRRKKLFHMHFNDNYRGWDDDMIVGTLHLPEYVELFSWLHAKGWNGWFSMDQYPYREDGAGAIDASIRWIDAMWTKCEQFGWDRLKPNGDAVAVARTMRQLIGLEGATVTAKA
jgi:sugar phosphate isomerase/epimerase